MQTVIMVVTYSCKTPDHINTNHLSNEKTDFHYYVPNNLLKSKSSNFGCLLMPLRDWEGVQWKKEEQTNLKPLFNIVVDRFKKL